MPSLRLYSIVLPVSAAGIVAVGAAVYSLAGVPPDATELVAVTLLAGASTLAERFPVPVDGVDAGGLSLGVVFGLSAIVLFGWDAGVLVSFVGPAVMQSWERKPAVRIVYNASVFALAAAGAGALSHVALDGGVGLVGAVGVAVLTQYALNMVLVSGVVSVASRRPLAPLVAANVRWTVIPFTFMGSAALVLVVLWQRSPFFSLGLAGPLLAIALYQRSTYRTLQALRLASSDPLTGLGNHRHFHERLDRSLDDAHSLETPFSLCLFDIDDFKNINDQYGHPVGDRVLAEVSHAVGQGREAFRLGGDEFAILLPALDEGRAQAAIEALVERVRALRLEGIGQVTISAGLAAYPNQAHGREELVRLADSALYWAKESGKDRVCVYEPDSSKFLLLTRLAKGRGRAARFRAAASLAQAVDARDAYTGRHSERVAELASRVAVRLGLDREQVELARLAGSLHDIGKLAIPEEVLRKPGPLTRDERAVIERHPQIGYSMLSSLGVEPVDDWVLHHHERWDGTGYPDRLRGEKIPLGARILFVADAFEAMTSDRVYRKGMSEEEALAELEACAGSQFDSRVVAALAVELGLIEESEVGERLRHAMLEESVEPVRELEPRAAVSSAA